MPVNPRGDSWQASVSLSGKRYRKDFATEREAKIWEAEARASLLKGVTPDGKDMTKREVHTLKDVYEYVVKARWKGTKAERSQTDNAKVVLKILGEDLDVAELNKAHAVEVKEYLRDLERSDATINRKLAALSVLIKAAVDLKWLPQGFTVGLLKERATRVRFFSEEEERAMLAWCDANNEPEFKAYLMISLDTGFRKGEVLKIIKQDVGGDNLWTYDTKSGKNREVPLTTRVKASLAWLAQPLTDPKAKVIQLEAHQIRWRWDTMKTALGMQNDEQFIAHTMRHTFVTRLLHRGVDIKTVQELAGHLRIETTQRYAQTSPARKVAAISVLDVPHATSVSSAA